MNKFPTAIILEKKADPRQLTKMILDVNRVLKDKRQDVWETGVGINIRLAGERVPLCESWNTGGSGIQEIMMSQEVANR